MPDAPNIDQLISISGGFFAEVNVKRDLYDETTNIRKLRGYIPNQKSRAALGEIVRGLHPNSPKRVHLITGWYGTGKSHLGLVLANLLALPIEHEGLQPLMMKIKGKDPAIYERICANRRAVGRYLVVVPEPEWDPQGFNHALLLALKEAMQDAKIAYPLKTYYESALQRISAWRTDDQEALSKLEQSLKKRGKGLAILEGGLKKLDGDCYNLFVTAYPEVTHGARFEPEGYAPPARIYEDAARAIRVKGEHEGIVVIFDEFGRYLSRLAEDPEGEEGSSLQNFAEYCKRSRENQCHLVVIAHQTIADYARDKRSKEEWRKIYGRFVEGEHLISIATEEREAEEMLNSIIQPKDDAFWQTLGKHPDWAILTDLCENAQLYPNREREWIKRTVVRGTFPLHPFSAFCLPWISERVGQRERTLFTFVDDDRPGGLVHFCRTELIERPDGRLSLYTLDRLFNYFEEPIRKEDRTAPIYRGFEQARNLAQGNDLAERILKTIAVMEIVGRPLRPTEQNILASLHVAVVQEGSVKDVLRELVARGALRYRRAIGEYAFARGMLEIDMEEEIRKEMDALRADFRLARTLNDKHPIPAIIAREYNEEFSTNRKASCRYISAAELSNPKSFLDWIGSQYSPKRGKYQGDALVVYVLAETEREIQEARDKAESSSCAHEQLVIAIPKSPVAGLFERVLRLEAMERLKGRPPFDTLEYRSEIEEKIGDEKPILETTLCELRWADRLYWYRSGAVDSTKTQGDEEKFISELMRDVFPYTLCIRHHATSDQLEGTDTKRYRLEVMDRLLQTRGKLEVVKSGGDAAQAILRATLLETEILKDKEDKGRAWACEVGDPPTGSAMERIFKVLRKELLKKDAIIYPQAVICKLLRPKFGLSPQTIDVLLATFLRPRTDEFAVFSDWRRAQKDTRYQAKRENLTGETVYDLVRDPEDFALCYYEISKDEKGYLDALMRLISPQAEREKGVSLWDGTRDFLLAWFGKLPLITRKASFARLETENLKAVLISPTDDSKQLLREDIPVALGCGRNDFRQILERFKAVVDELNGHSEIVARQLLTDMLAIFNPSGASYQDLANGVDAWYKGLPEATRLHPFSGDEAALIQQAIAQGAIHDRFFIALPCAIGLKSYLDWETDHHGEIVAKIRLAKVSIENWQPAPPTMVTTKAIKLRNEEIRAFGELSKFVTELQRRYRLTSSKLIEMLSRVAGELGK